LLEGKGDGDMITDTKTGIVHIMLDLETLDKIETAAIVSIGAVKFDLDNLTLGDTFYMTVGLGSCLMRGLTIDQETINWWRNQSPEARQVMDDKGESLPTVLAFFSDWIISEKSEDTIIMWGNGSTFDNMILRNAYRACGANYPISYKGDLCYRTMRRIFSFEKIEEGVGHHALNDARNQAQSLINFFKGLKEKR
jgi:exodeoxyribonuclease VIII